MRKRRSHAFFSRLSPIYIIIYSAQVHASASPMRVKREEQPAYRTTNSKIGRPGCICVKRRVCSVYPILLMALSAIAYFSLSSVAFDYEARDVPTISSVSDDDLESRGNLGRFSARWMGELLFFLLICCLGDWWFFGGITF